LQGRYGRLERDRFGIVMGRLIDRQALRVVRQEIALALETRICLTLSFGLVLLRLPTPDLGLQRLHCREILSRELVLD
jgi:hypothetical protein